MGALALRLQLIDAFMGEQSGINSVILADIFSSGGSKNVYMDQFARVKRILGYSAQGAAVTTNTGGSATRIRNLFPFRQTAGGVFVRQLIGGFDDATNEFEIWYSTDEGVTWTFIQDFGAGSINSICDFAQFGDTLFICNGVVAVRQWSGSAISNAGATQLAAPTSAASGTGVLSGSFKWKIVPRTSTGVRKPGSVASTSLSLQANAALLGWVADADATVVGYEIYRTTGTGNVFYYVDYVTGIATVAYTDNIADLAIIEQPTLDAHGEAPPITYHAAAHKQRMWYLRTDAFPQRGYYSDPGDPDSVWTENFVEFQDADTQGDLIVGAVGNYEGVLVVFEERSIWTVSGSGQIIGSSIDFNRVKTNAQTGAVSKRAIVRIPAGARYIDQTGKVQETTVVALAYMTPLKDIRIFNGDNDLVISHAMSVLAATLNYTQRRKTHTLHDDTRSEIVWFFAADANAEPSTAIVWNYRWGVMYEREWTFSSAAAMESSTEAQVLVGGSSSLTTGGITFQLWDTNTFNGLLFHAQWMTKTLYGTGDTGEVALSYQKRFRWVDLLFETFEQGDILVEWLNADALDDADSVGSVTLTADGDGLQTADGDEILTADGDDIVMDLSNAVLRARFADIDGRYLHDYGIRLRVGDAPNPTNWSMKAMTLAYQILPGLWRRRSAALNP